MIMQSTKAHLLSRLPIVAAIAIFCCALWGSATPFIKIGYDLILLEHNTASTILFAGIRFTLAGILTVLIYSIAYRRFLYPKKENLGRVAVVSCQYDRCQGNDRKRLERLLLAFDRGTHLPHRASDGEKASCLRARLCGNYLREPFGADADDEFSRRRLRAFLGDRIRLFDRLHEALFEI